MTSVRIVRPIIDTPSRMPDARATTAVTAMTVGRIAPRFRRRRKNVTPSSNRVCAMTDDEERQAEDEQHRVGVNQIDPGRETTAGASAPKPTTLPRRSPDATPRSASRQKVATMTQQHPVGQGVLVDLIPERAEEEEAEDGRQDFGGEEPQSADGQSRPDGEQRSGGDERTPAMNHRPWQGDDARTNPFGSRRSWRQRCVLVGIGPNAEGPSQRPKDPRIAAARPMPSSAGVDPRMRARRNAPVKRQAPAKNFQFAWRKRVRAVRPGERHSCGPLR